MSEVWRLISRLAGLGFMMNPQYGNGWWAHHGNYKPQAIDAIRQTVAVHWAKSRLI